MIIVSRKSPSPNKLLAQPVSATQSVSKTAPPLLSRSRGLVIFKASPLERVMLIKEGIPATYLAGLAERMQLSQETLMGYLQLPRATVNRKAKEKKRLSRDESERVLGIEYLIGQVESMVEESGNARGFDASRWIAQWLETNSPALGGARPADFLDTLEGQRMVSNILAKAQSGAYA